MLKILFICLTILVSIQLSWSTTDADCKKLSNTSCNVCLNLTGCAFCKDTKTCHKWSPTDINPPCSTSELQYQTCVADAQTLVIILASVGGVVLIIIIVIIACICCKCKQCRLNKLRKDQEKNNASLEARRIAAEERSAERNAKNDAIRMKYALDGGSTSAVEYRRMS